MRRSSHLVLCCASSQLIPHHCVTWMQLLFLEVKSKKYRKNWNFLLLCKLCSLPFICLEIRCTREKGLFFTTKNDLIISKNFHYLRHGTKRFLRQGIHFMIRKALTFPGFVIIETIFAAKKPSNSFSETIRNPVELIFQAKNILLVLASCPNELTLPYSTMNLIASFHPRLGSDEISSRYRATLVHNLWQS